jgi:cytochrome c551/c552
VGARLVSVSCASEGNCAAGGEYFTGSGHGQALVVSEVNGVWGRGQEVPGTGALNTAGAAEVTSVSCASAGDCSAGGYYTGGAHAPNDQQAFVVSEVNGVWGRAEQVPGSGRLNTGHIAEVRSVSCGAAGNCSAGGTYEDSSLGEHAFVVSQAHGVWGQAGQIPGTTGGGAQLVALSCTSAGSCGAAGFYTTTTATQAFVASQVNGTWGKAEPIPGLAALNQGRNAAAASLSCTSAGACGAAGMYTDSAGRELAFAASQVHGVWGKARPIPGATAPRYQMAEPLSVSCASAGNCATGGQFGGPTAAQAFVASQIHGIWDQAEQVPGSGALNTGHLAQVSTVSCGAVGNCGAGGYYTGSAGAEQAFVASQVNGTWGKAGPIPGLAALNTGHTAQLTSVSCTSAGNCSAAGMYTGSAGIQQAFVASQVNGTWGKAEEIHGPAAPRNGTAG